MPDPEQIAPARVRIDGETVYCTDFSDIYHSADGEEEVQRVFLAPSGLLTREPTHGEIWTGELGFGSGLNFAVFAQLCRKRGWRAHFVSCDAAPLGAKDFAQLARRRSQRLPIYHELNRVYPPLLRGWHRRHLAGGRITLSLFWGEAHDALQHLSTHGCSRFDAWFLDGFAPDRNPRMWSSELLTLVGALSRPRASVATFTAAGHVRRSLQNAGFEMRRVDQRPHKRESLAGTYRASPSATRRAPARATVVGAGLSGASTARQLAQRGVAVQVHEAGPGPASGASAIPVSMLHPRLLADASAHARLRCHAYLYSASHLDGLESAPPSGAFQLPGKNTPVERLAAIAERYADTGTWVRRVERDRVVEESGWPVEHDALWFPHSRVLDTPDLCRRLLDHPNIELVCHRPLEKLPEQREHPVILACGAGGPSTPATDYLELGRVHGQIDIVRIVQPPALPLIGNGYVVPWGGDVMLGSTYEYSPWDPDHATRANLARLPDAQQPHARLVDNARGTRCVSSDRLPVIGPVVDQAQQPVANLYVATAMGSMGNVFSHYAAELLASQICGEFPPATDELVSAVSSARFRQRQVRRGYRLGARN